MSNEYEEIEIENFEGQKQIIFVCVDCGAFGDSKEQVTHYNNCKPGESKKWKDFYNQSDEQPF